LLNCYIATIALNHKTLTKNCITEASFLVQFRGFVFSWQEKNSLQEKIFVSFMLKTKHNSQNQPKIFLSVAKLFYF